MAETSLAVAREMLDYERREMIQSAKLLHRRLGAMIERGDEGMGFDLPTMISLMARHRDAIESYRVARAVQTALAASEARVARLTEALETIRRDYGQVCEQFELCHHASCASSVGAWMEADKALAEAPEPQPAAAEGESGE